MNNRGFTLLEVLVAVAILAFIMTMIWQSTWQSFQVKDRVGKRDAVFQEGRVALRKLTDDLSMAFLVKPPAAALPEGGEVRNEAQVKTFFIGDDSGVQDSLKFTTLSNLRLFSDAKVSDQCKVAYTVESSPEEGGLFNLVRKQAQWLDDSVEVEGRSFVIAEGIKEFSIDYYDDRKSDWGTEWSTEKAGWKDLLPNAVRIRLVFPDPNFENEVIPMTIAILIPMSGGAIEM